ncbi:hypothetical protein H5410_016308 [Solanum commersonii]|uniref:F-box domain-containing protein n=1 Tax=Solanum commersonii TaxID=4109 RepID=A0A9J5ZWY7_SOLCO|nr:hypothetical protein H5410_016308 [Solanum commersonii]
MKNSVLMTIPVLPAELIIEILSRVPVKSLLKFRSVSKSWLALISTPEFINTHLSLSTNNNKDYTHHLLTMIFRAAMNGLYEYTLKYFTLSSLLYESVTEACDLDYPYKKLHNHFSIVDIWVMRVYGIKESWTKMLTIDYPDDPFVDYDYMLFPLSFISNKGEILVCFGSSKVMTYSTSLDKKSNIMTYNPKDDSFRYSKVINFNFDGWRRAEIYVESLVCPLSAEGRKNATKRKAGKTQVNNNKSTNDLPSHFPFSCNMRYRIRNPKVYHQIREITDSQSHILSMCVVFDPHFHVLKLLAFIVYDFSVKSIDYEVLDLRNEESSYSW